MNNLANSNSKDKIIKDFFCWLLEKEDVDLISEKDLSMYASYTDHNIYYPKEFEAFFSSKAMQRLGRINQLGLIHLAIFKDTYHTRLEHSKGTYYRKLEELIIQTENEDYKKYIEDNNLKIYLIAELLKMAGHDIGHFPLSHVLENTLKYRGFHEDIGKRILLENEEIQSIYSQIDVKLPSVMKEMLNGDPMDFNQRDESNYDVDRFDYLQRDALYAGRDLCFSTESYEICNAKTDSNGNILLNDDGSIILADTIDTNSKRIDVYERNSLRYIETFLFERVLAYRDIYLNEKCNIIERNIKYLVKYLTDHANDFPNELTAFLTKIKQASSDKEISIDEYIKWDDLRFLSNCIDIANSTTNKDLQIYIGNVIPSLAGLMSITSESLKGKKQFSDEDIEFIKKLKSLINDQSEFAKTVKNENSFEENTTFFYSQQELEEIPEELQELFTEIPCQIKAYKVTEPIFIKDKLGRIFSLDKHPDRGRDWEKYKESNPVYYVFHPQLKLDGISDELIEKIKNINSSKDRHDSAVYNQTTARKFNDPNAILKIMDSLEK